MPNIRFDARRLMPGAANHRVGRVKARMTEEFGHPSNVPVMPIEPSPGMVGRVREWSADHPLLSVAAMFAAPIAALALFLAPT